MLGNAGALRKLWIFNDVKGWRVKLKREILAAQWNFDFLTDNRMPRSVGTIFPRSGKSR